MGRPMPWIVGVSKPNQEALAAENLARQGYDYYYPRIKQQKPGKKAIIEPLFKRYLFILINFQWYPLRNTKGMSSLLMGEGMPRVVSPQVILEIKHREGPDGLIMLEQPPKFTKGQRVKVEHGPFAGHFALYDGMSAHERCRVLLNMLGALAKVELEEALLAAA
jgi:transcriptional antiterminator RfaH